VRDGLKKPLINIFMMLISSFFRQRPRISHMTLRSSSILATCNSMQICS